WTVSTPQGQNLQVQATVANGQARIVVDATGADGHFVDGATTVATIAGPRAATAPGSTGGSTAVSPSTSLAGNPTPGQTGSASSTASAVSTISLNQVAPGRYEGAVPAELPGSYLVQVSQSSAGQTAPA